jgi:poly(A) polymerase
MSALKRILCHPGIRELLELHRADALEEGRPSRPVEYCESRLTTWGEADLNPPALVTGNDIAALGMRPGPDFKLLLDKVRDAQLDGLVMTRENALEFLATEMRKAGEGD